MFLGVQGVFEHMKGVISAVSGYAGGDRSAHYKHGQRRKDGPRRDRAGHVRSAQITYGGMLQVFFSVAHDPTQLNRQGPDIGTAYRFAIFTENAEQAQDGQGVYRSAQQGRPVRRGDRHRSSRSRASIPGEVPSGLSGGRIPRYPYIVINDLLKVENLKRAYPDVYRPDPVLVATTGTSN